MGNGGSSNGSVPDYSAIGPGFKSPLVAGHFSSLSSFFFSLFLHFMTVLKQVPHGGAFLLIQWKKMPSLAAWGQSGYLSKKRQLTKIDPISFAPDAFRTIEQHAECLVRLLETCLGYNLRPVNGGTDPPHAKFASDVMPCIFLVLVSFCKHYSITPIWWSELYPYSRISLLVTCHSNLEFKSNAYL